MRSFFNDYANWTDKVWVSNGDVDLDEAAEIFGLVEEAGEVAGKLRKRIQGKYITREDIGKELGDVFYFWTRVAKRLGYTLEELVYMNQDKLESRLKRNVLIGEGDNR